MNKSNYFLSAVLAVSALQTAAFAADIGVSVNISQPGFYGRIDVGRVPGPVLIFPQPVIIDQRSVNVVRQPIYLRVPPGHERHWNKYCSRYQACGQPVYFVQDGWYRDVYEPRYYGDAGRREDRRDDRRDNGQRGRDKYKKGHGKD
ncbi:hypothetical protein [Rhodoferax sp.]|uniref:hypothetical protein n=1 Tax=Rhodoferax sp. TaxID=50421 RepID=UPI00260FA4A6|nr:hypothetical protein [Rhodoferax sp.]MDD2918790.1 hypothetical protein [Rhodoferax sp.]